MLSSTANPDKRLWLLGLLLGNCAGLLLLVSGNLVSRRFLETAFPYTVSGYYTADFVLVLGVCLGGLVFPALLTCLARRRYALWGLLPLCLLMVWVLAGGAIVRPLWVLPLAILLCWTISCGPIFLFRFVRQKSLSRRSLAPVFGPPPRQRRLLPVIIILPLLALVGLGAYNWKYPPTKTFTYSAICPLNQPIHVPLIKKGHGLYVQVNSQADDEALFRLDTGSTSVAWPRSLSITGAFAGEYSQDCDVLGSCTKSRSILLPHLQIGGYKVLNLPTEMSDTSNGLFSTHAQEDAEPLLGNPAFVRTVLTVDYKNGLLTIQNPAYDFTKQRRKTGDYVLEMGWQSNSLDEKWKQNVYGTPAIRVAVNGAPIWCTLDTGWDGPEMGLTKSFVDRHPSIRRARRDRMPVNAIYSTAQVDRLHDLVLTAPCLWPPHAPPLTLKVDAGVTPTLPSDSPEGEAAIGLLLMERYRITIDYQRGRVLLEPYARPVAIQKQENPAPGEKQ